MVSFFLLLGNSPMKIWTFLQAIQLSNLCADPTFRNTFLELLCEKASKLSTIFHNTLFTPTQMGILLNKIHNRAIENTYMYNWIHIEIIILTISIDWKIHFNFKNATPASLLLSWLFNLSDKSSSKSQYCPSASNRYEYSHLLWHTKMRVEIKDCMICKAELSSSACLIKSKTGNHSTRKKVLPKH